MTRILLSLIALAVFLSASAQTPDAVILQHRETFTMQSPSNGTHKVEATVLVNNEKGLHQAIPSIYTDSFRSIASFGGTVETGGRKVKFGKKDLYTQSISSGLAEDSYISTYFPSGSFPLTLRYEYTVSYKGGINLFPVFAPVNAFNVQVKTASYTLDLPKGTSIVSYTHKVQGSPEVQEKDRIRLEWTVKDFAPIKDEFLMPPGSELLPAVYAAPASFSYAGTRGSQSDWKEYGLWLNGLQKGSDELPESTVTKLKEMTKDCKSDFEILKVLYNYLRETTRYVAIELGIGKLKPIPAAEVQDSGFGDCKALSNYLYAMLKALAVPSVYYIINTRRATLFQGFTSTGQMNHAMLAVPLRDCTDTVFVECTNPSVPLGYRHESVAGHQIVLIKPDGGELTRVGTYADSLRYCTQRTDVLLSADGSAGMQVRRQFALGFAEEFFDWDDKKPELQQSILTEGFRGHAQDFRIVSTRDNFDGYIPGEPYCPQIDIDFNFKTPIYGRKENGRLFVPMNPTNRKYPLQKSTRANDICIPESFTKADTTIVQIPEGYSVESIPGDVALDSPWGQFSSTSVNSQGSVTIVQSLTFKKHRSSKESYPEFKEFIRKVNQSYDSVLVLKADE